MAAEDLTPRRTLAEVIEIVRDLALCADAADAETEARVGSCDPGYMIGDHDAWDRAMEARDALLAELVAAHRAGQLDAVITILTAHRARMLRQVADGMIDLVGQRGTAVARAAVQPHFQGDLARVRNFGIGDLDDLALAALDRAINDALAGVA